MKYEFSHNEISAPPPCVLFFGLVLTKAELAYPAHRTVLETASRHQGSELSSAYDDPPNDCGGGSDTQRVASPCPVLFGGGGTKSGLGVACSPSGTQDSLSAVRVRAVPTMIPHMTVVADVTCGEDWLSVKPGDADHRQMDLWMCGRPGSVTDALDGLSLHSGCR